MKEQILKSRVFALVVMLSINVFAGRSVKFENANKAIFFTENSVNQSEFETNKDKSNYKLIVSEPIQILVQPYKSIRTASVDLSIMINLKQGSIIVVDQTNILSIVSFEKGSLVYSKSLDIELDSTKPVNLSDEKFEENYDTSGGDLELNYVGEFKFIDYGTDLICKKHPKSKVTFELGTNLMNGCSYDTELYNGSLLSGTIVFRNQTIKADKINLHYRVVESGQNSSLEIIQFHNSSDQLLDIENTGLNECVGTLNNTVKHFYGTISLWNGQVDNLFMEKPIVINQNGEKYTIDRISSNSSWAVSQKKCGWTMGARRNFPSPKIKNSFITIENFNNQNASLSMDKVCKKMGYATYISNTFPMSVQTGLSISKFNEKFYDPTTDSFITKTILTPVRIVKIMDCNIEFPYLQ